MNILINVIINGLAVFITASILPGVSIDNFFTSIMVAVVLALVNTFIKPILILLTLPVDILTLGIFIFIINALLVLLVSAIVPGFRVDNIWWALLFSLVLSLISSVLYSLAK